MASGWSATDLVPDRTFQILDPQGTLAEHLGVAAVCLKGVRIDFAEASLDSSRLAAWSRAIGSELPENQTRTLREAIGRPVDPSDFVLWLDDVCASASSLRGVEGLAVPPGRARTAGLLVHPREVFGRDVVRYGRVRSKPLSLEAPPDYRAMKAPPDGSPVGPEWAARFLEPESDRDKLKVLVRRNPAFGQRVETLLAQLQGQGAMVRVESAVRSPERGYLIYGSYLLSRAEGPKSAQERIDTLHRYRSAWGLDVPIRWKHPDGFRHSIRAARQLADTFGVDFATPRGARRSHHYRGNAVDIVAVALPRVLVLTGVDGRSARFDLSGPDETRDLNLTPRLVAWVEAHFRLRKLRLDYPHWSDPDLAGR